MVSRFYFPADTTADVSPAFDTSWPASGQMVRRKLVLTKGSTALAAGTTITVGSNAAAGDRQYVSDPLSAQTISGTIKMQLMVREFALNDNVDRVQISLRTCSNDGSTIKATLLARSAYGPTAEFLDTGFRNKTVADGDSVTSTAVDDGDRLVLEIGHRAVVGATPEAAGYYGESASDLPEDEVQTSDGAGWVEFSADIVLSPLSVTPSTAPARALAVSPTVVLGSLSLTPTLAIARALAINPTVAIVDGAQRSRGVPMTLAPLGRLGWWPDGAFRGPTAGRGRVRRG